VHNLDLAIDGPAVTRRDKLALATVAVLGASAIAVTPVVSNTTQSVNLPAVQTHAYDLTAVMNATASPLEIYGTFLNQTFDNLGLLGNAIVSDPAPLLRQVLENQRGYLETIAGAFGSIPTSLQAWWEGSNGKARFEMALAELQTGNVGEAYRWFNHAMLYGFNAALGPLIAPGVFLSGVPRGGSEYLAGIPEQIAQNFTNLVAATFTRAVLVTSVFQGVFGTVSGAAFELSRAVGATVEAISQGDLQGALNAVINTPAILLNAVLNGFDYADPDLDSGTGGYAEWPALLTFAAPGETGAVAGLFQSLFVNIPKALAEAIAPKTPEATVQSARVSEIPAGVLDAPALLDASAPLDEVTDKTPAGAEPSAPAVVPVKDVTPPASELEADAPKVEAPAADAPKTDAPKADASDLSGDAKDATETKTTAVDRIKSKIAEAKEARQARAQEVKEKVAAAREARAEKRRGGAGESRSDAGSSSSSSDGGSSSGSGSDD
jgi:uncharacterized membrane protein YgcG